MSAQALREAAIEGNTDWMMLSKTTQAEFELMNDPAQVAQMDLIYCDDSVETYYTCVRMWMLFWAEFFDSEAVK